MDQLDQELQKIFKKLKGFSERFALAGGTAIMLQIGHRRSYDFDCFTEYELPRDLLRKARKIFRGDITPRIDTRDMLSIKTERGIEISFVFHPFKPIKKYISTKYIPVFHLDDLAANKAYTIGRRGAWRDYVDIFFLLKWKFYCISDFITLSKRKFGNEFNERLFLQQLTYFDDLNVVSIDFLKESYTFEEIKSYLNEQVRKYLRKILK